MEPALPHYKPRLFSVSGANLMHASIFRADLSYANLRKADLSGAILDNAILSKATLLNANLSGAHLRGANMSSAVLISANLSGADLTRADLWDASLSRADLCRALLQRADLTRADLRFANLSEADLTWTTMYETDMSGATLQGAVLGWSGLRNVDLTPLCDAEPSLRHTGPSDVDHRSVLKAVGAPRLKEFLLRTGMPHVFVEFMVDCALSMRTDVFRMLQSTFISYGAPDERFARRLYEALHRNGVATFFFPEHAVPGEKLHRTMRREIDVHDRLILVCSRGSLDRDGVLFEIEEALTKEARKSGDVYLIPIRIDDYVFTGWSPKNQDIAQAVRDRVVADFEGADTDEEKFQRGLRQLIVALRK